MTTLTLDHEDKLLGRLGASEQCKRLNIPIQHMIDSDLELLRSHGCDAFTRCPDCENLRAEVIALRKEQRMARGDFAGAQRLMR